jgi:A/G-specific adenine glycosylase
MEELVNELLPIARVGDFNQALMELGATICLPSGSPRCTDCPVSFLCKAYQQGIAEELPIKSKKKKRKIERKTIFVIEYEGKIAIRQRANAGLLSSLWEFPNVEGHLTCEESKNKLKEWGITPSEIVSIKPSKHIFTHLEWHMIGYFVLVRSVEEDSEFIWATGEIIKEQYTIPTAFKAYMEF